MSDEHNHRFRDFTTRTAFNLSLGTTHIKALVIVHEAYAKDRDLTSRSEHGIIFDSHFVPGVQGCIKRGLAWHEAPERYGAKLPSEVYGLTKAGELMVELLKEAGIWQQYVADMPETKDAAPTEAERAAS